VANNLCKAPRYGDLLELSYGLHGYFDLTQARRCAQAQHKPLFIDFTGHAYVNCRKMEATVWSDPAVLDQLRHVDVVVTHYVDDKGRSAPRPVVHLGPKRPTENHLGQAKHQSTSDPLRYERPALLRVA